MINSARLIVTPVTNIVFCCFVLLDLKSGESRDGRTTCAKTIILTGHDFGLAEWINKDARHYVIFIVNFVTGSLSFFAALAKQLIN